VGGGVSTWAAPAVQFRLGFAPSPAVPVPVDAQPHPEAATALAVSPDGNEAVVSNENRLGVYALASGRLLRELPSLAGMVRELAWSPDGTRILVSVFYDSAAHLLQAEDGHELGRFPVEREAAAVAFAPDGTRAAIGSETGPIVLVDVANVKVIATIGNTGRPVQALAFAGERLVSAGGDGAVVVWDVANGRAMTRAEVGSALSRIAVAPGGRVVASAGFDRVVRLHDVDTGALLETLSWHRAAVWGLAWLGPVLFSGDGEGEVAAWDLGDRLGATKETLTGGTRLD
jgi:DNA-binding beta-propeller fold protein YncE